MRERWRNWVFQIPCSGNMLPNFFHSNRDFKTKENEFKTIQGSCSPGRGIERVKSLGQK